MRVLLTITPRMYREAIAGYLRQHRPGYEVRTAAPEKTEEEVGGFAPHLLVRDDANEADPGVVEGVGAWVEVLYTDSMAAMISVDGRLEMTPDISMEVLLRVADEAAARMREP